MFNNSWLVLDFNLFVLESINTVKINHIVKGQQLYDRCKFNLIFFNIHQRAFNELNLLIKTLSPHNNVQCKMFYKEETRKDTKKETFTIK